MVFWVRCEKMAPEDVKENGVYPKPPKLPNTKKIILRDVVLT